MFWQVGTFGVFQTISDFVGWQVSILIQKYVYCSLHGMLEILFSIKILLITNEMKFTISNYLSATLTMFRVSLLSMFVYPKNAFDRWRIDAVPSYFRSPRVRLLSIYCLMYSKDWIFFWWIKYSWKRKLMLIPRSYPLSVTISSLFF